MTRVLKTVSLVIMILLLSALMAIPAAAAVSSDEATVTEKAEGTGGGIAPPLDVIFSLDSSGSMSGTDPAGIRRTGSKAFVDGMNPARDRAGVVSWDSGIDFSEPLTNNFALVKTRIDSVDDSGGTNLDAGLTESIDLLDAGGRPGALKVIIFLTDGGGSYTPSGAPGSQADRAAACGYVIHTVGLSVGPAEEAVLQEIANVTGGTYYFANTADDILGIFEDIAGAVICQDPLMPSFQVTPPVGDSPHEVQFIDSSSGQITEWFWDFGDGQYGTGQYPFHTYQNGGVYTVCLTVTGPRGTVTACMTNAVIVDESAGAPSLVVRNLNLSATQAQPRQGVMITADVFNEGGAWGSDTVDLIINGQFEQSQGVGVAPGTAQRISFTVYKITPGEYQVQVGNAMVTFYVVEEAAAADRTTGGIPLGTGGIIAFIVIGVIVIAGLIVAIIVIKPS